MTLVTWNINSLKVRMPRVLELLTRSAAASRRSSPPAASSTPTAGCTDDVHHTWWDYRQGHFHRGLGLRIDLALVSASAAESLVGYAIARNYGKRSKPSDHAPLVVELG